ncbi:Sphingosine kinase and enzyme [Roseovarius mucosus DSM 17069]|uniref:Sphingosine kinase and enzyme n=1 Tax=Roseovarius mucosus DSM 17069 TaxID=1288298 RepID=A0A0A0HQS9_9RHOB|nr:diacylglycerol kinase family protein [Roseovarius mucosus]KGM88403.1 Sphingosine kinase and enzyme [Roseovarius mucosus DSM 17069]
MGNTGGATRICMISNPTSGNNRKWQARIEARLAAYPQVAHHVTRSPHEAEELVPQLAASCPDVVVINGGDGTIAAALGMILRHWAQDELPLIVLLPGGTANMTAGDIGVASSHKQALKRFFRWLDRGAPLTGDIRTRHIMRVTGAADGHVRHGMFLGTGAIMQATRFAHKNVHSRGLGGELSLGMVLVRSVWGLIRQDPKFYQPTHVAIAVENGSGVEVTRDTAPMLILVASTLGRLFLGIRPFWAKDEAPIGLTAIQGGARRFARAFPSVLRGRPNRHVTVENGYESFRGARIELRFDGELNLDGELFATAGGDVPLVIEAEGPIRFLRAK